MRRNYASVVSCISALSLIRSLGVLLLLISSYAAVGQICAPIFNGPNGGSTVECNGTIPVFPEMTAASECCGDATVSTFTSETGRPTAQCSLSTAYGPGPDWAFWLPGVNPSSVTWKFTDGGHFERYADGTARVWGHIFSAANPNQGFDVSVWFKNARTWSEWSALGRSYKDDFNLAGDNYLDWTYYELVADFSVLTGTGALAGSVLYLSHQPVDYYYGFQSGIAANNKNANNGLSGWFYYNGTLNGNPISGHGDINVDQSCQTIDTDCASTAFTRYYRAADSCGNVAFTEYTIEVTDSTAPVVAPFDAEISLNCDDLAQITITATDACSGVTITYQDQVVQEGCNGLIIRNYTIADGCGNTTTAQQTIDLFGGIPPEFVLFPADTTVACQDFANLPEPLVTFNPGCDNTTLNLNEFMLPGECAGEYTYVKSYTLTDDCGNTVTRDYLIQVFDNTPPALLGVPADATIQCGDAIDEAVVFGLDQCTGATVVGVSAETIPQECGYLFVRTWFTSDECGNVAEASQTITVEDQQAPEFDAAPEVVTFQCGSDYELAIPTAQDACSSVTVGFVDAPILGSCGGAFVRTYTATDGCGNTATFEQQVTFVDDVAPVFTSFPENITTSCDQLPDAADANITYEDNCGAVTIEFSENITEQFCANSYILERTWTISDECGNSTAQTQTIYVVDEEGPMLFGVPEDQVLQCGEVLADAIVVGIDNCESNIVVSLSAITVETPTGSVLVRTWSATDACGNSTIEVQNVQLLNNGVPTWDALPADISVSCGEEYTLDAPTATDPCGEVNVTFADAPIEDNCTGSFVRTWIGTSTSGAVITTQQTITIVDDTNPFFTFVPADVEVVCGEQVDTGVAEAADACSTALVSFTDAPAAGCEGSIARTWKATDACGNVMEAVQLITVIDTEAPTATATLENLTVACWNDVPAFDENALSFTDNCAASVNVQVNETIVDGACANSGTVTRVWTAADNCGNITTVEWVITVNDTIAPELINAPASDTLQCSIDEIPNAPIVTAEDNCAGTTAVTFTETQQNLFCGFRLRRTWRAEDLCGNVVSYTQTLLVTDTIAPYFENLPSDIIVDCNETVPVPVLPTAIDECAGPVNVFVAENEFTGECPGEIIIQRVFRAFDNCGNSVLATQNVTIRDNTAPVFDPFPPVISRPCGQIEGVFVTARDACSEFTITYTDAINGAGCSTGIVRTYTAMDACGNTATAEQVIIVNDNVDPFFTVFPADVVVSCNQVPDAADANVQYADDCSSVSLAFNETFAPGLCPNDYILTRTWTVTDGCGNSVEQSQTITVIDDSAPVLFGVPADLDLECGSAVPEAIVFAVDNCSGLTEVSLNAVTQTAECSSSLIRTWFTFDECGNYAEAQQIINFSDTQAPQLIGDVQNIQLTCGDALPEVPSVIGFDACQGELTPTFTEELDGTSACPTIVRTWCVSDCTGNSECVQQFITFADPTTPNNSDLLLLNQNSDLIQMRFFVKETNRTTLTLRAMNGTEVQDLYSGVAQKGESYNVSIFTQSLSRGIYFVTMVSGGETITRKLVIAE